MQVTNNSNITLALAVWLLADDYDYNPDPNYISVTTLMKPIKQIVLAKRVPFAQRAMDVEDFIPRALGNSLHAGMESAWLKNYQQSLKKLGYPDDVIARVKINPTSVEPDDIPVYLEQRAFKQVGKWKVGGKFDMVTEGVVNDTKSTTAYSWLYGGKDGDYALQGSLYRWLNPDKITADFIRINFIFTDWQKVQARSNPLYPQKRVESKEIGLIPMVETDLWVKRKLQQIEQFMDAPEATIPDCTDEELWRSDPKFKYFSDPTKTNGRSTKNFDTLADANAFMASKGGKGVVITVPGEPKRCQYCDAFDICSQKNRYLQP